MGKNIMLAVSATGANGNGANGNGNKFKNRLFSCLLALGVLTALAGPSLAEEKKAEDEKPQASQGEKKEQSEEQEKPKKGDKKDKAQKSDAKKEAKPAPKAKPAKYVKPTVGQICDLIGKEATSNGLPKSFFARLIWKESRFDHLAVSPVGAQGIAQFMPGTAKLVGLKDPFDYTQAIPASARHLKDLKNNFGNLGLAAAAYNAGGGRVSGWLNRGGYLPFETEDYVAYLTGEPAENFANRKHRVKERPLEKNLSFDEACRKMPVIMTRTRAMAEINPFPWGIQIAGNFRRGVVQRSANRLKARYPGVLKNHKIYIQRRRTPMGRRGVYAARLGANSRGEANKICATLKRSGGACVVTKN